MIRIKDIAEKCGVSTATVSYVLHGKTDKVSAKVREKIEAEIKESGYISNQSAISLVSKSSGLIGVAVKNAGERKSILSDPYYGAFLSYLDKEFRQRDKYILILLDQTADEIVRDAVRWNLDGLVLCNHGKDTMVEITSRYTKPVVTVDAGYVYQYNMLVQIFIDDFDGGYQMGKYFARLGHTKAAMIDDSEEGVRFRWNGFKQALLEEGIEISDGDRFGIDFETEYVKDGLERIFPEIRKYTAIFCVSDFYALELIKYLNNHGIKVPEDVSVSGYDDIFYATLANPELSTIRQNIEQKAQMAADSMIKMIKHKRVIHNVKLPVELVERKSCREL